MTKHNIYLSAAFSLALAVSGCTGYNSTEVRDQNKDNEYVYGEVGGPARQLKNTYTADPNSLERANNLREKMFGSGSVILQEGATPAETAAPAPEAAPEAAPAVEAEPEKSNA